MKKIYSFLCLALVAGFSFAQIVNVTLQVDVNSAGLTLTPNGMRVAGNFATYSTSPAKAGGFTMVDWSPQDTAGKMTDLGGGIWSITIQLDPATLGDTIQYKFVNNNWGGDETSPDLEPCGYPSGTGSFNRALVVPGQDQGFQFCYNTCLKCDGSSPVISAVTDHPVLFSNVLISPNPTNTSAYFSYQLKNANDVSLDIYNMMGQEVEHVTNEFQNAGVQVLNCDLTTLPSGNYIYRLQVGSEMTSGNIVKQ